MSKLETGHTAGPWMVDHKIDGRSRGTVVRGGDCLPGAEAPPMVARIVKRPSGYAEGRANARLVANAPRLLEVLRDIAAFPEDHALNRYHAVTAREWARAAVAKATGEE